MVPLLDGNGVDLLVPREAGHGAERVTPDDPRYAALRIQAVDVTVPADPAAGAMLRAEFEARYQADHAA